MSYSDGLQLFGMELTAVQTEASAAEIKDYVMPIAGQVEDFGAYITEDFTAQAADAVLDIGTKETLGGTFTAKISRTLGNSNLTLKKGDAQRAMQTVIVNDALSAAPLPVTVMAPTTLRQTSSIPCCPEVPPVMCIISENVSVAFEL